MIQATRIYARFGGEVHDGFGGVDASQLYYRKEHADEEIRATKHALWMARAETARKEIRWWIDDKESYPTYRMCALHDINPNSGKTMFPQEWIYVWMEIHRKCRQKAKEYE